MTTGYKYNQLISVIMKAVEAKVVVLGSEGVGKTSLVTRYVNNVVTSDQGPTIAASFYSCKLYLDGVKVKLQVWDTAGQERFRAMTPMYYRNANAALLVFDLSQYKTYRDLKIWVQELQRNVQDPMILTLVGNKLDLETFRAVSREEAFLFASSIGANYFETSAVNEQGIGQVFLTTAQGLLRLANENKCYTLRRYNSTDSISAYSNTTFLNGRAFHLPLVHMGIPVDNNVKTNGVGRLERASWSIDYIAHGAEERVGWCCY